MLNAIKKLFGIKPAEPATEVPYKVETPLVQLGPEPVLPAGTEAAIVTPAPVAKEEPAKVAKPKAPAKPKAQKAPEAAAITAPKKPRAPRKPKAE